MSDIDIAPPPPVARERRIPSVRNATTPAESLPNLGLLAELAGTWEGHGFNLVARPNREGGTPVFLELNQTKETLKFDPISSAIPNRGFAQNDIELFGLTYLQQISDSVTKGALHIEPGIWVRQPDTTSPPESAPPGAQMIARMGNIPHGNSILAEGFAAPFRGPPTLPAGAETYHGSIFPSFNTTPFAVGGPIFADGSSEGAKPPPRFSEYTLADPAGGASRTPAGDVPPVPLPAEIHGVLMQDLVNDPIKLLQSTIARQVDEGFAFEGVALNIASQTRVAFGQFPNAAAPTVSVAVSDGGGGIENMDFLRPNALSALVYATFWITRVTHPHRRGTMLQLQYAQMVLLNFPILGAPPAAPVLSWPHVSVATLRKVFG